MAYCKVINDAQFPQFVSDEDSICWGRLILCFLGLVGGLKRRHYHLDYKTISTQADIYLLLQITH